jgi:predicted ATPase/signal transduction histidine kinase
MLDGPEGVGKTALVQEAHKGIAQARGFFAVVEFDAGAAQLPYAPVVRALRGVLRQILTEPEHTIERWRRQLADTLSGSASVLVAELPELALVLGPQQGVAALPAAENASRFVLAASKLVRAFCDPLHPLVLVLDDVQWADEPSLQLVGALLSDPDAACMLVVATLRMSQLEAEQSPWIGILQRLAQASVPTRVIALEPLTTVALNRLLSDTLQRLGSDTRELAQTVIQKTDGNPFFVKELLGALYQSGAIRFDAERGRWEWELAAVQAADMPGNVAHLLLAKIERLDANQRHLLQLGACVGPEFELGLLLEVAAVPEADALHALRQLVELGLLAPVGEGYQHVMLAQGVLAEEGKLATCRFSHDRVQQAARNLLDDEVARRWDLALGRALRARGDGSAIRAAGHLGRVLDLLEPAERLETARCLQLAARKAREAMAPDRMKQHLTDALSCLGEGPRVADESLLQDILLMLAEAEYLQSRFAEADALFAKVRSRARTPLERARAYSGQVELYGHQRRHHDAVRLGLEALRELGVNVPGSPGQAAIVTEIMRSKFLLRKRDIAALADAPEMADPLQHSVMGLMLMVMASAFFISKTLFPLLVLKMTNMSLQYGTASTSSFAYACYSMITGSVMGDYITGRKIADVAMILGERYASVNPRVYTRGLFLMGATVGHWTHHLQENIDWLRKSVEVGLRAGDHVYVGYAASVLASTLMSRGVVLDEALREVDRGVELLHQIHEVDSWEKSQVLRQFGRALCGRTEAPGRLNGEGWVETERAASMARADNKNPYYIYHLCRLRLSYLFERFEEGLEVARVSATPPEGMLGLYGVPEHMFFHALTLAQRYPSTGAGEGMMMMRQFKKLRGQLAKYVKTGPANFAHIVLLLDAERARLELRHADAQDLYDEAQRTAAQNDWPHHEAIIAMCQARYWESQSRPALAQACWAQALQKSRQWGATSLVAHIITRCPALASQHTIVLQESKAHSLDMASVLKATQTLSSAIQLDQLLERLMHLVMENAGAQRGVFLFMREAGLTVDAVGDVRQELVQVLDHVPVDTFAALPVGLVKYVARARQSVVLSDASQQGDFVRDTYIQQESVRSALALPIIHQGNLLGVLYLENNLTAGAFTEDHLEVLRVMSAQLAISLQNAQMYAEVESARRDLEQRVRERTVELEREIKQRELAQAQAIEASRSKSLFLANMSHELRTPLNALIGYSELLVEDMADNEMVDYTDDVSKIHVSARHLLSLINDILDLSKIEARKMELHLERVELSDLVSEVITTVKPSVDRHGNKLVHRCPRVAITTDRTKLRQVLVNLLSNAAKFTNEGEVGLHVTELPAHVELAVSDTGIGISADQQARLFQAFNQAESNTSAKFGGTGLGLALSRELSILMGGDIRVESEVGKGSTFIVTLPIDPPSPEIAAPMAAALAQDLSELQGLGGHWSEVSEVD